MGCATYLIRAGMPPSSDSLLPGGDGKSSCEVSCMENRFGIKDFFLFLLLGAIIVLVVVALFEVDRQWQPIADLQASVKKQDAALRDIKDQLSSGIALAVPGGVAAHGSSTSQPTTGPADSDPFARILAAQKLPDYANGGVLVDAFSTRVSKLTPMLSTDAYASIVQSYVLESLATRDPDTLEWSPLLSTGWQIEDHSKEYAQAVDALKKAGKNDEQIAKDPSVPDAIQIKFKMRPGVRFSDGVPLTADDVVFTYRFTMDPKINSPRDKAYLQRITKLEKTAPDEVTFTYHEPYFQAFELAAGFTVLPEHFYGRFTPEQFNQSVGYLMGSGPYRLPDPTGWKPGTLIQVVRNENYWGVKPAFDRMIWQEISNDAAHLAAFRNGDIDLFGASPEQYKEMIADPGLIQRTQHYEYQNPIGGYRYVAWNEKRNGQPTVFADKRVRQAMAMLIDRQRLIQEIMLGYAVPATGPFNPLSKQSNPDVKAWPHDVVQAQALLREAGYEDRNNDHVIEDKNGVPFRFKLTYPSGSVNYEKMVLFLKDSYARAGIILEPDPLDWSVVLERLNHKNFDAVTLGWTAGIETDIYQMFDSSQAGADGDNFMSYANPELDRIIHTARATVDEEARMTLWRRAHQILHEDQPYMFLFFPKNLVFLSVRIHNVQKVKLGLNPRVEWFIPLADQSRGQ
jgi:peptide/nickel transport system substrate-binding protein